MLCNDDDRHATDDCDVDDVVDARPGGTGGGSTDDVDDDDNDDDYR